MNRVDSLVALHGEIVRRQSGGLLAAPDAEVLMAAVEALLEMAVEALLEMPRGEQPAPRRGALRHADALQDAWEAGRACSLVGRGLRARVIRSLRLVNAGLMTREAADRIGAEAVNVGLAFRPLPVPPDDVDR